MTDDRDNAAGVSSGDRSTARLVEPIEYHGPHRIARDLSSQTGDNVDPVEAESQDPDELVDTTDALEVVAADEPVDDEADALADADEAAEEAADEVDDSIDETTASIQHKSPFRSPALGVATAAGLSTMTPVAQVTQAPDRDLGDAVLAIDGLTKKFDSKTVVDNVSFSVREGSFMGIVGPNGAGKTTTLSMATGLLRPTSGNVSILGIDVWKNQAAARVQIGVLPDRLRTFDQLTGAQLLAYSGLIRGLKKSEAKARAESLIDTFQLQSAANRLVIDYSAGMTKKIMLASALIHSPKLLVLDEPFESIDPVSAAQLMEVLFGYVERGGTVLLSSHSMDLVQRACDHVAVIVRGEILASGTVEDVRDGVTLEERFRDIVRGPQHQQEGLDWLGISFN